MQDQIQKKRCVMRTNHVFNGLSGDLGLPVLLLVAQAPKVDTENARIWNPIRFTIDSPADSCFHSAREKQNKLKSVKFNVELMSALNCQ